MKVALVYDRVNKIGGAERVLLALHELFPEAPLYTAVYNKATASWASVFQINESFLGKFPLARTHHELYPWLTPLAFESFDFHEYDLVISITSAEAKTVITKPETLHICYCLTPTRYLWSGEREYRTQPGLGLGDALGSVVFPRVLPTLKRWDLLGSTRPDRYIAISEAVGKRIETYYHKTVSAVIYPPVDTKTFTPAASAGAASGSHFFVCLPSCTI